MLVIRSSLLPLAITFVALLLSIPAIHALVTLLVHHPPSFLKFEPEALLTQPIAGNRAFRRKLAKLENRRKVKEIAREQRQAVFPAILDTRRREESKPSTSPTYSTITSIWERVGAWSHRREQAEGEALSHKPLYFSRFINKARRNSHLCITIARICSLFCCYIRSSATHAASRPTERHFQCTKGTCDRKRKSERENDRLGGANREKRKAWGGNGDGNGNDHHSNGNNNNGTGNGYGNNGNDGSNKQW
ncbi:hypothetical protein QQZ08_005299 [Neonectria magnoliae]|uniref:Uncharacterized protein n=1 Tax=Neonectria magnoliae TaxID=2732573 RepID=A0ABR1I3W0_9HYPO